MPDLAKIVKIQITAATTASTCGYGEELSGSRNAGNFLNSCKVYWLASQEGLCSME